MLQFAKAHKNLFLTALAIVVVAVAAILYGFAVRNYIAIGLGCLLAIIANSLVIATTEEPTTGN